MSKNHKNIKERKRTLSRLIAAQTLYQCHFLNDFNIDKHSQTLIENYSLEGEEDIISYKNKIDEALIKRLLNYAKQDFKAIDEEINLELNFEGNNAKIDDLLRQIFRLASIELKNFSDIPLKVIINEYIDVAALFFEETKTTFVNVILENLAKKYRAQELNLIKNG